MSVDATKELFEHVELFGKPALFMDARIDVSTVPLGFYCYNLRGSDNDPGRPGSTGAAGWRQSCGGCIDAAKGKDSREWI